MPAVAPLGPWDKRGQVEPDLPEENNSVNYDKGIVELNF